MKTNRTISGMFILVGLVLLMCSAASAETYYVSLKGDDANKGMTEKAPFRTIKKGVSVLKAGDTLIIKSGNYGNEQVQVPASGKKGAPVTIKAEVPGKVVVKGTGRGAGITISDKSYIIVEGIEFTNFATGITIRRASSYVTVRKCILRNNRGRGLILYGNKVRPSDSHHHLFTENQFLDLTPPHKGLTPGSDVRDTQDYGLQLYFSTNVEAVNNYFHGHHHQCLSFKKIMKNSRAAGNVFEGFQLSAIYLGQNTDDKQEGDLRSYNLVAEGNIFRPCPGYRAKSSIVVANVTGAIVRNNFIDSTYGEDKPGERFFPGAGINVNSPAVGTKIYGNVLVNVKEPKAALLIRADCEIYNNTVAGCGRAIEIAKGVKAVVRNNIFYRNVRQVGVAAPLSRFYDNYCNKIMKNGVIVKITFDRPARSVFDNNLWLPDWKGKGPHGISVDPRFVGPIKPLIIKPASPKYVPNFERMKAYRLKKSSPCIDKGVKTGLPFVGKSSDIGAFEFGKKAKAPIPKGLQVKCVECDKAWEIEPKDARKFHREMEMGGAPTGGDCPNCGEKKCVFLMNRCPACRKYYLSKRITDPDAFAEGGRKEICPHCNTDLYKWYKKHRRRR